MSVAVVVPTQRRLDALARCLDALERQSLRPEATVVVVDGGDPATLAALRDRSGVTVVVKEPARGFGAAVNLGVAHADADFVAILNDDAVPDARCLEELAACAQRHPSAAAVATKVVRADDPGVLDGCGDSLTRSLKAYRRGLGERDTGQYEQEEQIFSASGTACLWRRQAFAALGGFDESMLAYYEDVELGLRARLQRHECWYAPRAVVAHEGAATAGADWSTFESFHAVRNRWLMIWRCVPRAWLLRLAPAIAVGEAVSLAGALARGELRLVLRAYREVARLRTQLDPAPTPLLTYAELRALLPRRQPPARMAWFRFRLGARLRSAAREERDARG